MEEGRDGRVTGGRINGGVDGRGAMVPYIAINKCLKPPNSAHLTNLSLQQNRLPNRTNQT